MNEYDKLTKESTWDSLWDKYINHYIHSKPKHGKIVERVAKTYAPTLTSCLEMACGSARDSRYLCEKYETYCLDLSFEPLKTARVASESKCNIIQGNVFSLPFDSNSISASFHSGLLIYFSDNEDVRKILSEQKRVTQRLMIIFVHNKHDIIMNLLFKYLYQIRGDLLYNVRRYSRSEIEDICSDFGPVIEVGACDYSVPIVINKIFKVFLRREINLDYWYSVLDRFDHLKWLFMPTEIYAVVDVQ